MKKRGKRNIRKENFFRKNYSECWKYLRETKKFIWIIVILFFVSALAGFLIPISEILKEKILDYIVGILEKTQGMSSVELVLFILFNNLKSSFFGMLFGFFLGLFPVIAALLNGYLVGYVSSMAVSSRGFTSLFNLLPHGIFELPAIFISLGLGLKFGTFLFEKNREESFKNFLVNSIRVFVFVVVPLLVIAAIIEGILIFSIN